MLYCYVATYMSCDYQQNLVTCAFVCIDIYSQFYFITQTARVQVEPGSSTVLVTFYSKVAIYNSKSKPLALRLMVLL